MWTKRYLIEEAYAELALAGWVWDLQPEEIQWALNRMDMMVSLWSAKGVDIGYALPTGPDSSDPDQDSGIFNYAVPAVILNLARSISSGKGKILPQETMREARDALNFLYSIAAQPLELQKPYYLPVGAGSKPWRYYWGPFIFDRQQRDEWPDPASKGF